jgi:predicted deacylase
MATADAIRCDLDFDLDGKQFGNLDLVVSDNANAFGKVPIPLVTIRNGDGPGLLLSAGTHGDEYEGQVILRRLIHEIEADTIRGRLILLPALNYPAMLDNARVSPLDQGNLNRSFPGVEDGAPTAAIAHFVTSRLLPLCDAGIDLHSGGSAACYLPCAFLCTSDDPYITQHNLELAEAFDAPRTFVVRGADSSTGFDPVANRLGVPFISAELGGGANVDPAALEIGTRGVRRVMRHLGLLPGEPPPATGTRFMNGIDGSEYLSAPYSGIFSPRRELGDEVAAGEIAGTLFALEEIERPPLELEFPRDGTLMVRRNGARVVRGSHVCLVAEEMSREQVLDSV